MTTPTNSNEQQNWVESITGQLDASADSIDFVTSARLSAARARAVAQQRQRRLFTYATATTAAICLCALVYTSGTLQDNSDQESSTSVAMTTDDLLLLSATEELEFLEELEFFEWMDEADSQG